MQTTVNGINETVQGLRISDIWSDYKSSFHKGKENIKNPRYFERFKKEVIGATIAFAERQGKNVLIHLSNKKTILVHMKMTGHFMYGKYIRTGNTWEPEAQTGPLRDPFNKYIRLVFTFSNKHHLVFSDLRKFGKIFLFETDNKLTIEDLLHLGPDPLTKEFTFARYCERVSKKPLGKIKQVLMDQHVISGIGNIYSDEILWSAGVHPLSIVKKIPQDIHKRIFTVLKPILKKGIDFGGDSDSDYRNIHGEPGKFQHTHNAYRKTGLPCPKRGCTGTIQRIKVGGRSAHFCPVHQKHY